jgi:phosphate transport system permease protein
MTGGGTGAGVLAGASRRDRQRLAVDRLTGVLFRVAGVSTIALLAGIFAMLAYNSAAFLAQASPVDFFTGSQWDPDARFGIVPLVTSTALVSAGAMLLAVPVGILTATFLAELAPRGVAAVLKPAIELLAAVPSVAIGFLGIVLVGPQLARWLGVSSGLNALNGAILLAVMALPTLITVSEDAIRAVPASYREASTGLGATRWQTLWQVTLPAAVPGLLAAVLLGLGRALGETMTVLMATGNAAAPPRGFLDAVRTITATIAIEMGEVPYQTTHYFALFAVAMVLFLITLVVNLAGELFTARLRRYLE